MIEPMNVPDDLKGMYAEALLYSEKPWYWLQIVPSKIISLIERIARLEAENVRLSAPVTDAEWTLIAVPMNWKLQTRTELVYAAIRASVNALLAARKGAA